jgi:predicted transcriptional regulator
MVKKEKKMLKARSCYGHLGGTLGERIFEQFLLLGWFEHDEDKTTVYKITPKGEEELTKLGVDIYEKR